MAAYPHSRINVTGVSGSGKSSFAQKLAAKLDYPYIEMDPLFWGPNWSESSDARFFAKLEQKLDATDSWILDGNYSRTKTIKWKRATQVIWIDHSFPVTLYRAVKRAIQRAYTKQEIWPGSENRESFRKSFLSHDSPIFWTIISYKAHKKRFQQYTSNAEYKHIDFLRLSGQRQVNEFLREI